MRVVLKWLGLLLIAVFLLIQIIPYGHDHSNPSDGQPITWDSPRTEELMTDACMDCHSNLTKWPWYSNIAPISWLVLKDVEDGRDELNLSTGDADVGEMVEKIEDGSMPPWQYKPTHPGARLSDQEKEELIQGIEATFSG